MARSSGAYQGRYQSAHPDSQSRAADGILRRRSMMDGTCDVSGCTREIYMGWRPLTERQGRQICEYHWRKHRDPEDSFDLFDAFGFRRPVGLPRTVAKRRTFHPDGRCRKCRDCGQPRESGHRYCDKCGKKRKAESNRKRQQRYRDEKRNAFASPLPKGRILAIRPATGL